MCIVMMLACKAALIPCRASKLYRQLAADSNGDSRSPQFSGKFVHKYTELLRVFDPKAGSWLRSRAGSDDGICEGSHIWEQRGLHAFCHFNAFSGKFVPSYEALCEHNNY
eukprot:Gregarina_sp_Poly_1__1252@NODE_1303_length_4431_cov_1311_404675_g882_i0_p4_GENE_NODE_1303_length_4431_cov_1311_404675_g882_i0NODE_1303_length_4431_cov_1311_404675_g882_i0_p4_ORF_typecomplete_len110_score8_65_NODE_1303_length_4431_cov_1311_404675_g882_i0413742